ncbi:MAG: hypothetical protein Rubg2KO_31320 [Rubricoccaceae bacterium]
MAGCVHALCALFPTAPYPMRPLLLLAALVAAPVFAQSTTPTKPIYVWAECVGQQDDGSYYAWFSYANANIFRDANGDLLLDGDGNPVTVTIASGSNNRYSDNGSYDLPTEFLPGNNKYSHRVEYQSEDNFRWELTGPDGKKRKTTKVRNKTWGDCAYDSFADVELDFELSDPSPEVGEQVEGTITLRNEGTITATQIHVQKHLPEGVTYSEVASTIDAPNPSVGHIDPEHGWTVDALAPGEAVTLRVTLSAAVEGSYNGFFEVECEDQRDIDSRPADQDPLEDDYAAFSFTTRSVSGGGDGGLESDGSLATLLARRDVTRMLDRAENARLGRAPASLVRLDQMAATRTARSSGSALDLHSLFATEGPGASTAYVTTPEDLLLITNAKAILSADYMQEDGDRVGVSLAVLTPPGETYDHTKAICDRVKGSRLESVRTVDIEGARYVLLQVARPDGSVDYAISIVAYPEGEGYTLDSRFRAEEYAIAQGQSEDVLNVQTWAATPEAAIELVRQLVRQLGNEADLEARNWGETLPGVPSVFVRGGTYVPGALALDIANTTGVAQTIQLSGTTTDMEEGERDTFERTLTVPADGLQTEIELANIFDIGFSVVADEVTDYVYLADGVWTYTSGDANDKLGYTIEAGGVAPELGVRPVERNARLVGTTETWAGLFRSIQPGTRPTDMTAFDALAFDASGTGRVQVLLNKTSTNGVEPFHVWVDLTEEAQTFYIPFEDLRRGDGSDRFTADDMTLIAFYTYNEGGAPTPFDMNVSNVRFEQSSLVANEETAEASLELAIAPNPSRGAARVAFTLPEASNVTVEVLDLLGRRVSVLAERSFSAGSHTLSLPETVAAGTYLVRLQAGRDALTRTLTRLP